MHDERIIVRCLRRCSLMRDGSGDALMPPNKAEATSRSTFGPWPPLERCVWLVMLSATSLTEGRPAQQGGTRKRRRQYRQQRDENAGRLGTGSPWGFSLKRLPIVSIGR